MVQPGDTLWDIASELGVGVEALRNANPEIGSDDQITDGQVLTTPGCLEPEPGDSTVSEPAGSPVMIGLMMPIAGACLPTSDRLMPNAPRTYRFGIHEGVDLYGGYVCVQVPYGTPVLAAASGTVTVATHEYQDLTPEQWDGILERSKANGDTLPDDLYVVRGRQVEIDHGDGIRTRYAHLSEIAPAVTAGSAVEAGQVIGYVGNSGIIEAYYDPSAEIHLHFEIRVDDSYLGARLPAAEVRALYERAFSLR